MKMRIGRNLKYLKYLPYSSQTRPRLPESRCDRGLYSQSSILQSLLLLVLTSRHRYLAVQLLGSGKCLGRESFCMMDCQRTCGPRQRTRLDDAALFKLRLYRGFRHPCACVSEQEVDQVCQVLQVCVIGEEGALDIASMSINRLVEQGRHDGMEHSPALKADPVLRREKLPNGQ